jgi:hypothetical protein
MTVLGYVTLVFWKDALYFLTFFFLVLKNEMSELYGLRWEKAQQASVIRKIGHLQRLACICISGGMRSIPSAALETLLMLPPLNIFIEK